MTKLVLTDEMNHAWSKLRTEDDNRPCRYCHLCGLFEFLDPRFPPKESKCVREVVNPVRAPIKPGEKLEASRRRRTIVAEGRAAMHFKPVPRQLED